MSIWSLFVNARTTLFIVAAAALCAVTAAPAYAHHSFAMFKSSELTLKGSIKAFQWTNPHIWIQIEAPDPAGKVIEWSIEGNSPNVLARQNWTRHTIKVGDNVTMTIHPLKDGRAGGSLVKIVTATGLVIGNGSSGAEKPGESRAN